MIFHIFKMSGQVSKPAETVPAKEAPAEPSAWENFLSFLEIILILALIGFVIWLIWYLFFRQKPDERVGPAPGAFSAFNSGTVIAFGRATGEFGFQRRGDKIEAHFCNDWWTAVDNKNLPNPRIVCNVARSVGQWEKFVITKEGGGPIKTGDTISLRGGRRDKICQSMKLGETVVSCEEDQINEYGKFIIYKNGGVGEGINFWDRVNFKNVGTGNYCTSDANFAFSCNRPTVSDWEQFIIYPPDVQTV